MGWKRYPLVSISRPRPGVIEVTESQSGREPVLSGHERNFRPIAHFSVVYQPTQRHQAFIIFQLKRKEKPINNDVIIATDKAYCRGMNDCINYSPHKNYAKVVLIGKINTLSYKKSLKLLLIAHNNSLRSYT